MTVDDLLAQAQGLLHRMERLVPADVPCEVPWQEAQAFRWVHAQRTLQPVPYYQRITLSDLLGIESQKQRVRQNTLQFVLGGMANNVLLSGARGTGKSSLVKALLNEYADQGLRVIQLDKQGLVDLPIIIGLVQERSERFILYCDDLSFNADEPGYQAMKAALDGDLVAMSDNLLIYATSNRRHLMPEYMQENFVASDEEIHPAESVEEKILLSERFGLWVSFYPFNQEEYLDIVAHWLQFYGWREGATEDVRAEALRWALLRGSRSGRVAGQFARDWCGARNVGRI